MCGYYRTVIYRPKDERRSIEVTDDGFIRALHFDNAVCQSATDLSRQEYLVLTYIRTGISSLLFKPSQRHVLLIGLGGGSLAKFSSIIPRSVLSTRWKIASS